MTITSTSSFYDHAAANLRTLTGRTQTIQEQISSGKKLTAPSEDAVGYQRLQTIARAGADDVSWGKNISLARTVLNQADTSLDSVANQLQKAQELVVQASSGTLSDSNRAVIATQLRGIVDDLVSIANGKDARGGPLFGSATGDTAVTRDAAGVVSFTGTGDPVAIPVGDGTTVQPSESAQRIFGGLPSSGGTTDVFALLSNLATALEAGGSPGIAANDALSGVQGSLDQVSSARGSIGARGARLDLQSAQLDSSALTRETERSGIEDTDLTTAIVDLQKTSTILQATQSSLAKLSSLSLFDYLR
ncbi:flagellar hook-associated protein FlgL [Sphingomonas sp. 28-63-12]|uniref:flagellar hook-associated protein FlgL n=1 Tax=Sphingomonas sp. 28-63-12 TaxID=1970434 RepID=UPI000BD73469|nr:MAG: flagellar hook-associated protein 3 [Sphingomonas sp. 28-63-12]